MHRLHGLDLLEHLGDVSRSLSHLGADGEGRHVVHRNGLVDGQDIDHVGFTNAQEVFYEHIYPLATAQKEGGAV